jgi:hypothetical protein
MKVIFLDINGVLCSMRSAAAHGGYPAPGNPSSWDRFDETAIALLRAAVTHTGARVVLGSNWRDTVNLGALEYRLGIKIHDVTRPATEEGDSRGARVLDWLAAHPEVERYAILDDDDDFYQNQMDKLCLTSKRTGFLLGHYDEMTELLGVIPVLEKAPRRLRVGALSACAGTWRWLIRYELALSSSDWSLAASHFLSTLIPSNIASSRRASRSSESVVGADSMVRSRDFSSALTKSDLHSSSGTSTAGFSPGLMS